MSYMNSAEMHSALDPNDGEEPDAKARAIKKMTRTVTRDGTRNHTKLSRLEFVFAIINCETDEHHASILKSDKVSLDIGRSEKADLTLTSPCSSRTHAIIELSENGNLRIRDYNSTNGTFLNNRPLETSGSYPIADGDLIEFGRDYNQKDGPASELFEVGIYQRLPKGNRRMVL